MKESGIDWIGQIPEEWEVVRLQDIGDYKKGPFGSAITIDMFIEKSPGSYKVYEQKNAIRGNCEIGEAYIPKSVYNNLKNFSVYPLDIIVSCAGTIGKCYILPEDCEQGIINQALMRVRVNKSVNLEYFLYIFDIVLSYAAIKYSNGSAIKNIPPFNVLNKLRVTLPSNIEQHQIVNYLDKKTAQLDKAKALLEEQIQKLKDYRASLIYETVTKGLDKTVPMKDSGIDWIGQVPQGWGVSKLKFILEKVSNNIKVGPFGSSLSGDAIRSSGKWVYNQRNVLDNNFTETDTFISDAKWKELKNFSVVSGDILLTTRGTIGRIAIVPKDYFEGILHPCLMKFRVDSHIVQPRLIKYFFNDTTLVKEQLKFLSNSTTIDVIYSYNLKNIIIPIIPMEEQYSIVEYLDKQCSNVDALIKVKQEQIKNINKQRQTLIYDYVTGKRRV